MTEQTLTVPERKVRTDKTAITMEGLSFEILESADTIVLKVSDSESVVTTIPADNRFALELVKNGRKRAILNLLCRRAAHTVE